MLTLQLLVIGPRPLIFENVYHFSINSLNPKFTKNQNKMEKETVKVTKNKITKLEKL